MYLGSDQKTDFSLFTGVVGSWTSSQLNKMADLYQLNYILHCWTSVWFFSAFYVSAVEYCEQSGNDVSTASCDSLKTLPTLPDFPDSLQACLIVTTTELPSTRTWSTAGQPTTDVVHTTGGISGITASTPPIRTTGVQRTTPITTTSVQRTTPITTSVQRTAPITTSQGESTTVTDQPISSAVSSHLGSHTNEVETAYSSATSLSTDVIPVTQNETFTGTDGGDGTTVVPTTSAPPGRGLATWAIIVIVFGSILLLIAVVGSICVVLKKNKENGKVHCCASHTDTASNMAPMTALSSHDPGSTGPDQDIASNQPISDAQADQLPHVPDSKDAKQDILRDRTMTTGSRAGETAILMPDNADTSHKPKKKKKKKKDEMNTDSPLNLKPMTERSNQAASGKQEIA